MSVKPGDILRDRFRIDALIGRGGMGQVFGATLLDTEPRQQVAIKVVSRLLVDDVLMMRLHREAEAASRIRSDYVPRVFEVADTPEGETFLVMERLIGEPLSQRIREHGALPWNEVARVGEDVLRALIDAHAAGIVHRDLKPSNVFLALKSGRVRAMVLDFGVCKMDGVDTERLTQTGESIGTVAYMAPEQIRGAARVDERADLYAFGVLVFEMICGRLPHEGPSQMAILASKLENSPARLHDWSRVPVPKGVDALVAKALERNPALRFANAGQLLEAWRALVKTSSMVAAGSTPPPPMTSPVDADGDNAPTRRFAADATPDPSKIAAAVAGAPVVDEDQIDTADDLSREARALQQRALYSAPPPPDIEPHPTQTSLTTHHTGVRTNSRGARLALIGAVASLVLGVIVVGVSVSRDGAAKVAPSDRATATDLSAPAAPSAPPLASSEGVDSDPGESFELPPDPTSSPRSPPRPLRPRPRSTTPAKSANPRFTSAPRY